MLFKYVESLIANYFSQSNHGGYLNCGSGERRKKKEWVTCLQDNPLAVAGSGAGIWAHIKLGICVSFSLHHFVSFCILAKQYKIIVAWFQLTAHH